MDIQRLLDLRHALHAHPDLADDEEQTASRVKEFLSAFPPDRIFENLGGHGFAAVYRGQSEGPRVLLRADLDALAIPETVDRLPHGSRNEGVSHKCGHDGHMTMLSGLATLLSENPPARGEVVLLYQPAEETGQGARRVLDDPAFQDLGLDRAFALHNLPGFPMGSVVVRPGVFASSSRGMIVELTGATSHAAEPHQGRSPALAVAQLIESISAAGQLHTALHEASQATIIHARVGERAFGTSPGKGVVMTTLRTHDDDVMQNLATHCTKLARAIADAYGLEVDVSWTEEFPVTENHPHCVDLVRRCADRLDLDLLEPTVPFPWSEDFGWFAQRCPMALVGLGAGEDTPALHHPTYDFPDELVETGVRLLRAIVDEETS